MGAIKFTLQSLEMSLISRAGNRCVRAVYGVLRVVVQRLGGTVGRREGVDGGRGPDLVTVMGMAAGYTWSAMGPGGSVLLFARR
jgi:hypothetical protein